jgi:TonB-linked SusC/RagA family outer membrane protein
MLKNRIRKFLAMSSLCLLALLTGKQLLAQQDTSKIAITGRVRDELKTAMPGVTIINLATQAIVNTDAQGNFRIMAKRGDSLSTRQIGYKNYTVIINKVIDFDIVLEGSNNSLNEVVVVGFGQQKKISLVGAQSSVKVEDLKQPVANLSASLAGRISGLVGVQRTGLPGSNGADLWIRGISTFNQSGNNAGPLIVVDGVQGRDINSLDPEDISSFTILKDASATAVYGVAGANGVIILTTKKGKSGKPTLMVNYNQGFSSFTKKPELTDGVMYMMLRNEAQRNSGLVPEYSNNTINSTIKKEDKYLFPNVDWMKELFDDVASNRRANFSSRGGSDNSNYYVSLAYYDEKSLLKTDGLQAYDASTRFKRYNFTTNVSMDWTSTTKFDLGVQGYITNTNYPAVNPQDAFASVMQTNPVLYPLMYPGNIVPGISSESAQPNPYAQVTQTGYQNVFSNQIYTNARITQDLKAVTPGLTISAMYSFDAWNNHVIGRSRTRNTYLINKSRPYNADGTMNLNLIYSKGSDDLSYSTASGNNRQYYTEASVNYERSIDSKNHISAMILYNQREQVFSGATSVTSSLPYRSRGLAGRGTYSYDDKYFAEVNFGYNGSENFNPQNRYGFFPSFGVGWVLSNESFFKPLAPIFQFFKLRYSDGQVGEGGNGGRRFGYLTIVSTTAGGFTFGTGSGNVTYGGTAITDYGTDVTWAKSHKQDLGIELKMIKRQLSLTADIFKERRSGVFLQRGSLPTFVGLNSAPGGNLGTLENKGFDATIELSPVQIAKGLTMDIRGTFTYNMDKVIENDQPKQPFEYMERRGRNYLSTFGYTAIGLFQSPDEIAASPSQSALGTIRVGDIKYKDLNNDKIIDANDVSRIGHGDVPTTVYGFGINFNYKGFYIGAFFQGVAGADRLLGGDGIIPFNNSTGPERSNLYMKAEDRWTEANPNPNAFYPRLAYGNTANKNNAVASSWWVKDISFLRLKTGDVGYVFPSGTFRKIGLKTVQIYAQAVNLFYWSKFDLWDPELNSSNGARYPNTRSVNIGCKINF